MFSDSGAELGYGAILQLPRCPGRVSLGSSGHDRQVLEMSILDTYLKKHFLNARQLAAACDISTSDVADWVERALIPEPSYIVTGSTIRSHAFGEMEAVGSTPATIFTLPTSSGLISRGVLWQTTDTKRPMEH